MSEGENILSSTLGMSSLGFAALKGGFIFGKKQNVHWDVSPHH